MSCGNTKKASILLVRKLYTLMQALGPLPNSVCLNMKLAYYDDGNYAPHSNRETETYSVYDKVSKQEQWFQKIDFIFRILRVKGNVFVCTLCLNLCYKNYEPDDTYIFEFDTQ